MNRKIIILVIIFVFLVAISTGIFFYLRSIGPVFSVELKDTGQVFHEPNPNLNYFVNYQPTFHDKIVNKIIRRAFLKKCDLWVNGELVDSSENINVNEKNNFILNNQSTGEYAYKIVCLSARNDMLSAPSAEEKFNVILPLRAKEVVSMETSNSQMALLVLYHDMSPDVKIDSNQGYVIKDHFLDHELGIYKMNFGNSVPKYYPKLSFDKEGVVSVKVRSEWKDWHSEGQVIKIITKDDELLVFLPDIENPTGESLFYIADDGSTYFGKEDHYQYHNEYRIDINLAWEEALQPEHLARAQEADYEWMPAQVRPELIVKDCFEAGMPVCGNSIYDNIKDVDALNEEEMSWAASSTIDSCFCSLLNRFQNDLEKYVIPRDDKYDNKKLGPKSISKIIIPERKNKLISEINPGPKFIVEYQDGLLLRSNRIFLDKPLSESQYCEMACTKEDKCYLACWLMKQPDILRPDKFGRIQILNVYASSTDREYFKAEAEKILGLIGIDEYQIIGDFDKRSTIDDEPDSSYVVIKGKIPDELAEIINSNQSEEELLDMDNDGLSIYEERQYMTNPNDPDTDGDGYSDGDEVKGGYDPNGPGKLINDDSDNI